ncbi:hypothetical protein RND81_08G103900 [Saponaria officinalis]|uniref:Uncharacterized protein n=1 Tax=Saponaria officinalis TaxID=3572 RepID=A0AAW1J5X3_SAPOF
MNLSTFIGSHVTAFVLLWRLTLVGIPFVLFLIVPGIMYGRTSINLAKKLSVEYNKAGSIAEQPISSVRTVYAFVGEMKTMSKFSTTLDGTVKLGLKQGNGVTYMIWAFNAWYGSRLVMYHGAKGGTVFLMVPNLRTHSKALGSSLSDIRYFLEAASSGERILEMIKRVPTIDSENMDGMTFENVIGEVEFKHVQFTYPTRSSSIIFQDLSLRIPAKKTVAIVGRSGCGKSTPLALLQRFYEPENGKILLDGVSIDKLQVKWLRSQMAVNILFGKENATIEEVVEAAIDSNAHNFISQLPQGYDTQVGERGVQMSGGQKQRIAVARAIIRKPCILLLDEATSSLDSESERVVQEALDKAIVGRTTITIAHRLSTIRNADIIAVIDNGQVMELGSHEQLLRHEDGIYTSLLHLQQTKKSKIKIPCSMMPLSRTSSHILARGNQSSLVDQRSDEIVGSQQTQQSDRSCTEDKGEIKLVVPSYRRLLASSKAEWKQATIGCVGAMLFGAIQPVYSLVTAMMISLYFIQDHDEIKRKTTIYALCFLGFGIFSILTSTILHYNFAYMGEYLTKRVREELLSKILTFEVGWFDQDQNATGTICSGISKDANVVRSLVGDRIALLVQTSFAVSIAFLMGLVINWRLAIVMIALQPLSILCFYVRRTLIKSMSRKTSKSRDESSKLAAEAMGNIRTIVSFSSQDKILAMLAKLEEAPRKESIRQSWYAGLGVATTQAIGISSRAMNLWYGGKLITQNLLTAKELFETFIILGADSVSSVFAILDRCTKIEPNDPRGYRPDKVVGAIEFQNVDFSYPTRNNVMIFTGFSIDIEAGKSSALVGQSGSGKSTIISLIERFYDPLNGVVKIDGRDIKTYNLKSLRMQIALVSQEPTLFAGTIRENIIYGASDNVDESEITKAAEAANAHDFISGLKDGYDTLCGDRGVQLSGGQKQRVAIARAILRNPSILLLDEATSALDSESEKVVQDALEKVMVGRTSVVVAHRLSTIQNCDLIVVLDNGKVVEKGSHSSLLEIGPGGAYYSLVSIQRTPTATKGESEETGDL